MSATATHESLINRIVTAVSYDGHTGAIRSLTFGGVGTIDFPARGPLETALDHLVELERELTSIRAKQDALITPAHSHARHFLVEQGRRNRSVHG